MGSRIAAHLANAGIPVVLLDIVPPNTASDAPASERNRFALSAIDALKKSKPAAFYTPASARLLTPGNFDDDLALLASCDWIIEAVAENLDIKHALLSRVAEHLSPTAILTTNTSGLPISSVASGLPAEIKPRFFGTHFFNPPRYMRLVEIIRPPQAAPGALSAIATTRRTSSPTASAPSA
jgi:3-hydroxyacyl-CoA dehydrogenase